MSKLAPTTSEDDNLNGSSIIQDMLEIKEFYQMICKRENLKNILTYAFSSEPQICSQNAALAVLNAICHWYGEKHKMSGKKVNDNTQEDEDMIMQGNSDEEAEDELGKNMLAELQESIPALIENLKRPYEVSVETAF